MTKTNIPSGYKAAYGIIETEEAIKWIKDFFERELAEKLNLTRISAPLFVEQQTGLNDNLNGVEQPVSFQMKSNPHSTIEIVHSLAKWKRMALYKYNIPAGKGIYTDMNAIRKDETLDNTHSIYVDQWDWEKVITSKQRTLDFLEEIVRNIYAVFVKIQKELVKKFAACTPFLPVEITFITSQELENRYPNLSSEDREKEFAKEKGAIFVEQIGKTLRSGNRHDKRAPDYDDWELNGDLILWNPVLNNALELSSMGIRVDSEALSRQLELLNLQERKELQYHKMLLNNELPLTIGGGIGQSRICMFLLQKAHIGEVQASVWDNETLEVCKKNNIQLL